MISANIGGVNVNYSYSSVIDNFAVLNRNSYGTRVIGIIDAETYVYDAAVFDNAKHSDHIRTADLAAGNYEVLDSNYYKKSVTTQEVPAFNLQNTVTTEFFFD